MPRRWTLHEFIMREAAACGRMKPKPRTEPNPMRNPTRLTEAERRMLERLAQVPADKVFACGGHQRATCFRLAERRLADCRGYIDEFTTAYSITESGRAALAEGEKG